MATSVFDMFAKLSLDSSAFEKGLASAKSGASALGSGIKSAMKVGIKAIGVASTAISGFAMASVKTGESFDKSISQVVATMGKSMDDMESLVGSTTLTINGQVKEFNGNLREFAQFMGQNTAFSAKQAADALNYMALAGYDVQTSMDMLPNVLNLAAAGSMDLARASDMVTDAATAMGLVLEDGTVDIERTSLMVDEMAKAASTGNTSVEQLGDAFLVVGGLAKELNGGIVTLADGTEKSVDGIQEMEIALTAMANAGIKGSEAGTHMRNMIMKLSSPTDAGAKTMEQLGVSVFNAEGNMRSLQDIMGDLNGALENLTQEKKIQAISDLFNARDLASAEALLGAVDQDWNKIGESILNAEGAAQKMADTQLDNLAGDITLFKSALEGAQIAISDVLTPTMREFVQLGTTGIQDVASAFTSDGLEGAMGVFGGWLSDAISKITEALPTMVGAGVALIENLISGIHDNIGAITTAGIEIVGKLATSLIETLPEIGAIGATVLETLNDAIFSNITVVAMTISKFVSDNIDSFLETGINILNGIIEGIVSTLPEILIVMTEVASKIMVSLIDHLPDLIEAGLTLLLGVVDGIIKAIPFIVKQIPVLVKAIIGALTKALPQIIIAGQELLSGLLEALPEVINLVLQELPNLINMIADFLLGDGFTLIMASSIQMFMAIIEALPTIIDALVTNIPEIIQAIISTLIEAVPQIIKATIMLFGAMVKAFPMIIKTVVSAIPQILSAIVEGFQPLIGMLGDFFSALFTIIGDWFKDLPNKIAHAIGAAIGAIARFFEDLPDKIMEYFLLVVTKLGEWATSMKDLAISTAKKFVDNLIEGVKSLPESMANVGRNIVEGIKNGIKEKWDKFVEWFKGIGKSLTKGFEETYEINSPSKVFARLGGFLAEGVEVGWKNEMNDVQKEIGKDLKFKSNMDFSAGLSSVGTAKGSGYITENDIERIIGALTINFYNTTEVDGEVINEKSYKYTVNRFGSENRAVRLAHGGVF